MKNISAAFIFDVTQIKVDRRFTATSLRRVVDDDGDDDDNVDDDGDDNGVDP